MSPAPSPMRTCARWMVAPSTRCLRKTGESSTATRLGHCCTTISSTAGMGGHVSLHLFYPLLIYVNLHTNIDQHCLGCGTPSANPYLCGGCGAARLWRVCRWRTMGCHRRCHSGAGGRRHLHPSAVGMWHPSGTPVQLPPKRAQVPPVGSSEKGELVGGSILAQMHNRYGMGDGLCMQPIVCSEMTPLWSPDASFLVRNVAGDDVDIFVGLSRILRFRKVQVVAPSLHKRRYALQA